MNFLRKLNLYFTQTAVLQVIPPKEWIPRKSYEDVGTLEIKAPISQLVMGQQGVYQVYNIQKKPLTVSQFMDMANSDRSVHTPVLSVQLNTYTHTHHIHTDTSHQRQKTLKNWSGSFGRMFCSTNPCMVLILLVV